MGQFAKDVRRNKIPGPNQRGFDRPLWKSKLKDESFDKDDKRLLLAGLFFDSLLTFLREEKRISSINLTAEAIIRFSIAIATANLFSVYEMTKVPRAKGKKRPTMYMTKVIEKTIELQSGQKFTPDELITGLGDGLKHLLRELLSSTATSEGSTEYQADLHSIDQVNVEINKAILYQCAVEYWNDCVGNGYGLEKNDQGVALVPFNSSLEIARTVSTYRRQNIVVQDAMLVFEYWTHKWSRETKEELCEIPLVSRVSGYDRIEHIELAKNSKTLASASSAAAAKLWLKNGYYKFLLDDPLPNFSEFSLNQILLGWQLLQSLSVVIFDSLKPIEEGNISHLLRFAPRISKDKLCATFAKALSLDKSRADQLVDVFVFDSNRNQEIWFQPLIPLGEDYCLVVPCIHSVQLLRIVEGWMRQGGLDLDRRGPEFERFCRAELAESIQKSSIRNSTVLLDRSFTFTPRNEREEEIDIVVIVSSTVLLIEAKCILWPDDSLQFANYRDTVEKAVIQIVRKRDSVVRNPEAFVERLRQLGYEPPENYSVIACVLTNSAVYSGFPIDGIPIVDLSILEKFFENEHVKIDLRNAGNSVKRHAIKFFEDALEAGRILEEYLANPPQLVDTRESVKQRELVFPVESSRFGKIVQKLYTVEIDVEEMRRRYGM